MTFLVGWGCCKLTFRITEVGNNIHLIKNNGQVSSGQSLQSLLTAGSGAFHCQQWLLVHEISLLAVTAAYCQQWTVTASHCQQRSVTAATHNSYHSARVRNACVHAFSSIHIPFDNHYMSTCIYKKKGLTVYWTWRRTEFPCFTLKFQYSPCYVIFSKQCYCMSFYNVITHNIIPLEGHS